mmetsp:Transcript_50794/g.119048  ORF Transcript_50794/g.119048 Transcript_50794/m.119048 type:complete len:92 (-) Transcript_50794:159-434(-)
MSNTWALPLPHQAWHGVATVEPSTDAVPSVLHQWIESSTVSTSWALVGTGARALTLRTTPSAAGVRVYGQLHRAQSDGATPMHAMATATKL